MTNPLRNTKLENMNRRELLGGATTLLGGALAGAALQATSAFGQNQPAQPAHAPAASPQAKTHPLSAYPNYNPPVVQVAGGKLRGFKDGTSIIFLGVPYAEAERFELPKPVAPWEGILNAQAWGPSVRSRI
jgi:hypothetical protein